MKYMLLIYMEDQALDDTEREHCYVESNQLAHELKSNGQYLGASPLQPTSTATSVRGGPGSTARISSSPRPTRRLRPSGLPICCVKSPGLAPIRSLYMHSPPVRLNKFKGTPLSLRENDAVLAEGIGSPKATAICWTATLRNRRKSCPKHSGTFTMLSKLTR